jgi:hypothetical protein
MNNKIIIKGICILALAFSGISCNKYANFDYFDLEQQITDIHIGQASLTIEKRSSGQIEFWPIPANADLTKCVWTSADPGIASVNEWGVVNGIAAGTTTLTCAAGNVSKTVSVTVMGNPNPTVPVPVPYAVWTFDDEDFTKGGTATAKVVPHGDITVVGGAKAGDKAIKIPDGPANYLEVVHGIPFAEGVGVKDWSMVLVVRISNARWHVVFQSTLGKGTDIVNNPDGDLFFNGDHNFGQGTYFGPGIEPEKWYILVFSRDGSNGLYNSWLNNVRYHNNFANGTNRTFLPLSFGIGGPDEDGEDHEMSIAELRLFDRAITPEEAYAINFEYLEY